MGDAKWNVCTRENITTYIKRLANGKRLRCCPSYDSHDRITKYLVKPVVQLVQKVLMTIKK